MSQPSWIGYNLAGRYKIDELVGQGGMSAVYKATDTNLRRVVAVKLVHSHLTRDPKFVRRFEQEAAAVAQLSHPNIVQVFDFDHEGETYYMVLEFIVGEPLQDRLTRLNRANRQMPLNEIVEIMSNICHAAEYAHRRDMIHRDIKPANIMLNVEGKGVLMDFGSVKILGGEQHTATGGVIGTAPYMSPEQVRGERADERADIYSLGVTLFEMVSGRPPFEADTAATTMMMHLNNPVPDIRELNPGTPDDLKAIIDKALAKNPADRYQSAGEMASALLEVQHRLKGPSAAATILEQPEAEAVRAEATVLEPTLVGKRVQEGTVLEAPPVQIASAIQPPAPGGEARLRQRGKSLVWVGVLGLGAALFVALVIGGLLALTGVLGPSAGTAAEEPATGPTGATDSSAGSEVLVPPTEMAVQSPYGELTGRIAFTRNPLGTDEGGNEIYVLDLADGGLSRLTTNDVADWIPVWSPDGQSIAFTSYQADNFDIWVMNSDGSGQTNRIALPAWDDYPVWSPDGSELAFASTGSTSGVPNSEIFIGTSAGDVRRVTFNTGRDEGPSWAADGQWLADASDRDGDMDIYLFTADGNNITQWTNELAYEEQPTWSPDGEWIAFIRKTEDTNEDGRLDQSDDTGYGNIWIGHRDGSEFQQLTFDHQAAHPAWSPDGQYIVFAHFRDLDGNARVDPEDASDLWVIPAAGDDPIALLEDPERDWAPDWTAP